MKAAATATATSKIVAYYRVSTQRQGLGLDAQRNAVLAFAAANGLEVVEEISEKESGREDARPGLSRAIAIARKHRAILVAAKVDRISRDNSYAPYVFFKAGIAVRALNLPEEAHTDPLLFGVYAGLAQREAELISTRTKDALAVKKSEFERLTLDYLHELGYTDEEITPEAINAVRRRKGWKLGRPDAEISPEMRAAAAAARREAANTNPANVAAAQELRRFFAGQAKRNLSAAARHLNERQLYTSRGVFHTAMSVKLLIKRFAI